VVVVDAFDEALSVPCIEGSGIHIANIVEWLRALLAIARPLPSRLEIRNTASTSSL